MESRSVKPVAAAVGGLTALAIASSASAFVSVSNPFVTIRATSSLGTGTITVPIADIFQADFDGDTQDDYFWWGSFTELPIYAGVNAVGGTQIATLVSVNGVAVLNRDPGQDRFGTDLDFTVSAGAQDTTFEICGPEFFFPGTFQGMASASGTLGGTDQPQSDFDQSGITITPALPNGNAYAAAFNGLLPGGSIFTDYFDHPLFAPRGSSTAFTFAEGNMSPPGAFQPVPGLVSSLSAKFAFTLSANDQAGGTSTYAIVPAPAAGTLLSLAGLGLLRRRR